MVHIHTDEHNVVTMFLLQSLEAVLVECYLKRLVFAARDHKFVPY